MSKVTDVERKAEPRDRKPQPTVSEYVYPLVETRLGGHRRSHPKLEAGTAEARNPAEDSSAGNESQTPESAWDQGLQEGERRARAECELRLAKEREALLDAIRCAARERADYFRKAEAEVVQLALAIASKILHREAQVDPMFLRGAVRVALDNVAAATEIRMRVPAEQLAAWSDQLAQFELEKPPVLEADASLQTGQCVLETDMGTTDLSWEAQLKGVEQGFLDLLTLRPRPE